MKDYGIGTTKNELVNKLGTNAKSGTKASMEAIAAGGVISVIGQFGVGLYSRYLVRHKIRVITENNEDEQYIWESAAGGSFKVQKEKEDQSEFLEERRLQDLVKKHLKFIGFVIELYVQKSKEKEVTDLQVEDGKKDDEDDDEPKIKEVDEKEDEEKQKKRTKKVKLLSMHKSEDVTNKIKIKAAKSLHGEAALAPRSMPGLHIQGRFSVLRNRAAARTAMATVFPWIVVVLLFCLGTAVVPDLHDDVRTNVAPASADIQSDWSQD